MHATITIVKWTPIKNGPAGKVKTSGEITISGSIDVVQELMELLKAAGYEIL